MADGTAVERRYSSADLAPIVGVTKRAISRRAKLECWRYETVTCRGGQRRMYPLSCLPGEVQMRLDVDLAEQLIERMRARMQQIDAALDEVAALRKRLHRRVGRIRNG